MAGCSRAPSGESLTKAVAAESNAVSRARRPVPLAGLRQAFDEARFGTARTLNLRESHPTRAEAVARAETWLRQRQTQATGDTGEVLIITGRGNNSPGGVSVVRDTVLGLLQRLKRKGVVAGHQEHSPGSFVVTLAPVHALWDAPKRSRHEELPLPPPEPASLDALDQETRMLLRDLAQRSLEMLGVRGNRDAFVEGEMLRQFAAVAATLGPGPKSDERLRAALRIALEQYD
jgi:Smr domain